MQYVGRSLYTERRNVVAVEITHGVTDEARVISVAQFCDELDRATLRGARDDQSAEGEALWELFDALRERYPVNCSMCVVLPRKTVDEVMATVGELMHRAGIQGHHEGFVALGRRLTSVPPALARVL